jgi:predicted DNA binding CopG/RHH family protein
LAGVDRNTPDVPGGEIVHDREGNPTGIDPLFVLQDASRNEEQRDAAIGFSAAGRLLTVVHISSSTANPFGSFQRGALR